jgi:hypothetical protein
MRMNSVSSPMFAVALAAKSDRGSVRSIQSLKSVPWNGAAFRLQRTHSIA